ncbi:iron uptake porin [Leptolyngbya boryana CZ1]|uniref:S-layer region-like protein n=3 Tax=Leptolyngbya group TaxID=3081713 RepID=A0A1Z4JHT1_LEPBY|nr:MULTISPECIES: iron uptake porin [Leptolyngbya]MBD1855792.1 carbohydrate porin [Leptolyngbya sp. FACHB-1624]MBD2366405.1 carbohydrate porin [Leptolyngbya sp. FACHB-161]MBD2372585.1 carbohydrate porin [Leptolyngbya sp. FACHB-238]MBD2397008.1 carbohydrate porin [Leptolyngbya sp. FACHB-239]MBD2403531.1 carbohydrate porin [Leptolyngbya sp. FACHB-402]BAY56299.1 S-layer region-like protein [Leptolyngbya boryana NIES-2135]
MKVKKLKFEMQVSLASLVAGSISLAAGNAIAAEPTSELNQIPSVSELSRPTAPTMSQVTSVSQLSDVRPTDWAFQALQSLVERYGCIAGYPDRTYRGNRALTRYEFAAGLNACLDRVNELIAAATADLVKKEDLATLQKLQEQFAAELATLRGRVDSLEARTSTLEKQQFSTTTKLSGEAIFSVANGYESGDAGNDANTVFNNRVRLNLNTSFTGKDLLITGLQAQNFGASGIAGGSGSSIAQTLGYADPVFGSNSNVRLSYEPQFPTVDPSTLTGKGANNSLSLYKLLYIFPVADKVTAFAGTSAEVSDAFPSVLPWASEGQGALSRFASLPAAQRVSGGTSQTGLAAAAGVIFNISDAIDFRALYGSVNANIPGNRGLGGGTPLGAGVGGGSYVAAAQLTVKPSQAFTVALNYAHSYHQINILGTGLSSSDIGAVNLPGGLTLGNLNQGIKMNTLGATAAFRLSQNITLAGSYSHIFADLVDVDAGTNFNSWLVGLYVTDILKKGNSAGLIFGQPLKRVSTDGIASNPENRTPYQVEGFFNFRVNDNLSITPGVFAIFNPEGQSTNGTAIVPVIRTTFTF